MRRVILAGLVLALMFTCNTATAANPCGGGGNGRQGGPVRTAFQTVRENMRERRAARGCQPAAVAFRGAPAVESVPVSLTLGSSCPGGVCYPAVQR